MRLTRFKPLTRWLLFGIVFACMVVQLDCSTVQATSVFYQKDEIESPSYNVYSSEKGELHSIEQTKDWNIITVNQALATSFIWFNRCFFTRVVNEKVFEQLKLDKKTMKEEASSSAVLMFTGDLMCLSAQQNSVNTKGKFDFTHSFSNVKPIFQKADIVVGNLETLVSPSNPYTYKLKMIGNAPNCNAMESYLDALVYAGFDAVVTANNHSLDGSMIGIEETISKLDESLLVHTGTFSSETEQPFILYEVNGITIAILSYTESINNRAKLSAAQVESYISCYSKEKVIRDVQIAKRCNADYIVAYNHWGIENTHDVSNLQKQHAMEMAEAGVDLILGSHPHCLQEADYFTTSDGRKVLCVYSLGNFVSSMARDINNDTIVLKVKLYRRQNSVYTESIGYYPMKVFSTYQKMRHVVLPVSFRLNYDSHIKKSLEQAENRIRKVIGNQISVIRY